jgi:hypothetical protein
MKDNEKKSESNDGAMKHRPQQKKEVTAITNDNDLKHKYPNSPINNAACKKQHFEELVRPQEEQSQSSSNISNIIDIAKDINLEPGARLQVQWDLHFDGADEGVEMKQTKWWGGTLLQPDGRTHELQDGEDRVKVPIRVIDYDPYVEAGFPERSLEDVCFLSDHSLLNISSDSRAYWRREDDAWEPTGDLDEEERKIMSTEGNVSDDEISVSSTSKEDALKIILDTVLQNALQKAGIVEKMKKLDAFQQRLMAEKIARAKRKLTEKLLEQVASDDGKDNENAVGFETVITKEHIAKCMEELQNDL